MCVEKRSFLLCVLENHYSFLFFCGRTTFCRRRDQEEHRDGTSRDDHDDGDHDDEQSDDERFPTGGVFNDDDDDDDGRKKKRKTPRRLLRQRRKAEGVAKSEEHQHPSSSSHWTSRKWDTFVCGGDVLVGLSREKRER